ncbi:MAG: hypothetical protein IK020_02155 [Clostridiales bacterium]|nr:hypothetical protein [Clostridiales bacterium]
MKKYVGLYIVSALLIAGCLASFLYLTTHDVFKAKETVTLTKSSETVAAPAISDLETTVSVKDSADEDDTSKKIEAIGEIEAAEVGSEVAINLPAELFDEVTQEQIDEAIAKEDGFISGTVNADGSVTYVMTREKYDELILEMQATLEDTLQKILDDPECPNIVSISHNEAFSEYTVRCSSDDINLKEELLPLTFYMSSGMYFQFLVDKPDNVYITYINDATGEVIYDSNAKELAEKNAE